MKILGVDPGSRKTGYGIIESEGNRLRYVSSGTFYLGDQNSLGERLLLLSESLKKILAEYQPECGAIEKIFFAKNAQSALVLGHARGVILLELTQNRLPIHEYTPLEIKKTVVGVGRASKEQVQHMVKVLLNSKHRLLKEDEADALAIAITHAHLQSPLNSL